MMANCSKDGPALDREHLAAGETKRDAAVKLDVAHLVEHGPLGLPRESFKHVRRLVL